MEFGITVTRQTVQGYDPTKTAGRRCAPRWQQLFEATRRAFVRDTSEIAIAHRTVRLRALSRIAVKAEEAGNLALAVQVYEVAAKECGDAFTNRRQLSGPNGRPLQVQPVARAITPEMSHAEAAELYRQTLVENGFP